MAFARGLRLASWSVRRKLVALLVAASLLPLATNAVIEIRAARARLRADAAELLAARADQLRRQLDALHRGYRLTVTKLARLPALIARCRPGAVAAEGLAEPVREIIDVHVTSDHNLLAIGLADRQGQILVATERALEGKVIAQRGFVRDALADGAVISGLHVADPELGDTPVIAYGARVGDSAAPGGVIVLWLRASALWDLARSSDALAGAGSFAVVVDEHGIRVAHTSDDAIVFRPVAALPAAELDAMVEQRRFGRDTRRLLGDVRAFPELGERARSPRPDTGLFRGWSPVNRQWNYATARRLASVPWTVFYLLPEREVELQIAAVSRHHELGAGLVLLVTFGIGAVLAARILRPVVALSAATAKIRGGDLSARVAIAARGDEIAQLCDSFNAMADRIQRDDAALRRSRAELEDRVAERTAELVQASLTEARARAALEVSTARLEILSRTAHELATVSGEIDGVLELAVRRMGELIGEVCGIRLVSEDGAWLEPATTFYHPDPAQRRVIAELVDGARTAIGEGIAGRVAASGEPVRIAELSDERVRELGRAAPAFAPLIEALGIASLLTLPLRSRDRTIGVVTLLRSTPGRPYTLDDQRFAQEVADRAGLAIDNAVLVATLERRVEARTAALEAANQELEAFSYSVSHDLRAPLRAIDGFSQVLLADHAAQLDADGRDCLHRVRAASQRMAALIEDLLNLARITRGHLRWAAVDLSAIAGQIIAELRGRDPARTTVVHIAPGLTVRGDDRLLTIALENLLGNAWKFTAKHPAAEIWFDQRMSEGRAVFCVRDTGAGFDMNHAHKLFAPFQRLHTADDYEGVGVGLATVQRIVSRHGGTIWVDAEIGRGAAFFFTLGEPA